MAPREPLHKRMSVFVEEDLTKFCNLFLLVVMVVIFTPCPLWLAMLAAVALVALRCTRTGRWNYGDHRIDGQTAIVTGATAGIGLEVASELHRRGARVILACRNLKKAQKVAYDIEMSTNANTNKVQVMKLDLCSFDSVRKFADTFNRQEKQLHLLINNAGQGWQPHEITEDGCERTLQVNHLAPFLLTHLLLDKLKQAEGGARVVNLASLSNYGTDNIDFDNLNGDKGWDPTMQYNNTKLMNVIHAKELSRRLQDTNVTVHSNCPGLVRTQIVSHINNKGLAKWKKLTLMWLTFKTVRQGIQTTIMLATDPIYGRVSGNYYSDCKPQEPNKLARDQALVNKLWTVSEQLCGITTDTHITS